LLLLASLCGSGCDHRQTLNLYFMAHPALIFLPMRIAVAPAANVLNPHVGIVFDSAGYVRAQLYLPDANIQLAALLARRLADAGLRPMPIATAPEGGELPSGVDFVIAAAVEQMQCVERYLPQAGGSESNFVISAQTEVHFTLANRGGEVYSADEFGDVGFPVEREHAGIERHASADPADALSAAVAQTISELLSDPRFQQQLPRRLP
jgi:hypothetical protein